MESIKKLSEREISDYRVFKTLVGRVQAEITIGAMKAAGVDFTDYTNEARMKRCECCDTLFDSRDRWMKEHTKELGEALLIYKIVNPGKIIYQADKKSRDRINFAWHCFFVILGIVAGLVWRNW